MTSDRNPSQNGKSKGRIYWFIGSKGELDNRGSGKTRCDPTLKTTGKWDSDSSRISSLSAVFASPHVQTHFLTADQMGETSFGHRRDSIRSCLQPQIQKILSNEYIGHLRSRIQTRTSPLRAGHLGTVVDPAGVTTCLWANRRRPGEGTP